MMLKIFILLFLIYIYILGLTYSICLANRKIKYRTSPTSLAHRQVDNTYFKCNSNFGKWRTLKINKWHCCDLVPLIVIYFRIRKL